MLNDDKLSSEGYHGLMEKFNIEFINKSVYESNEDNHTSNKEVADNGDGGLIVKTPLLIAAVKWIDLATGHQV